MEKAPIFITGCWRSGTTLISRILNNHQDLDITYDSVHFLRFSLGKYNPINDKNNVEKLVQDTSNRLFDRYGLNISVQDTLNSINGDYSYRVIYDSIMKDLLLKKSQKIIWGEKTNIAWTKIPDFLEMYPEGRVVHIIRDPRAVLSSWKKFTHAPGNDYLDSIFNCYDSMKKGLSYKSRYADKRYELITYENLVSDPINAVRSLCDTLDIDFDKSMLDTSNFTNLNGKKWKANSIHDDSMSGISTSVIDKWKDDLEDWEIFLTDTIMGNQFSNFGYTASKIDINDEIVIKAKNEVQKSQLVSDGIIRFALTDEGIERYPSDPLNSKNWGTLINKS